MSPATPLPIRTGSLRRNGERIAADYAHSAECLQVRYDEWLAGMRDDELALAREQCAREPETMLAFLRAAEDQNGGVEAYLRRYGVTADQLERLRVRLVE